MAGSGAKELCNHNQDNELRLSGMNGPPWADAKSIEISAEGDREDVANNVGICNLANQENRKLIKKTQTGKGAKERLRIITRQIYTLSRRSSLCTWDDHVLGRNRF